MCAPGPSGALTEVSSRAGAAIVGDGLKVLLDDYFDEVQAAIKSSAEEFYAKKALNVIVLTNGAFSKSYARCCLGI